ncbi:MAG: hypothetical protein V3U29_05835 [Phycisphaeraceae bacterium]
MSNDQGDQIQREVQRLETAPWAAPRGPKTKAVAWVIIVLFGLCVVAMLIAVIAAVLR